MDKSLLRGVILIVALLLAGAAPAGAEPSLLSAHTFRTDRPDPRTRHYLPRLTQAPQIDGQLDDPAWSQAWTTDQVLAGGGGTPTNRTRLMMGWDAGHLYLAARCEIADPSKLLKNTPVGVNTTRTWADDCVELRLSLDNGVTAVQFLVGAGGAHAVIRGNSTNWEPAWRHAASIQKDAYHVEMAIPLAELGVAGDPTGLPLLLFFGRNDRATLELLMLSEPWGDLEHSPIFVLGTKEQFEQRRAAAAPVLDDPARIALRCYLDREVYPSFEPLATGRVRVTLAQIDALAPRNLAVELRLEQEGRVLGRQRITPLESSTFDFDLPLRGLAPGSYQFAVDLVDGQRVVQSTKRPLVIQTAQAQRQGTVRLTVPALPVELPAWPLRFGVPMPWGALDGPEHVRLLDAQGREVPVQVNVTGRWSRQGSVRWLLVDAMVPARTAEQQLRLEYGPQVRRQAGAAAIRVQDEQQRVTLDTGAVRLVFNRRGAVGLAEVWLKRGGEYVQVASEPHSAFMVDEAGVRHEGARDPEAEVVVEAAGPLRSTVRVSGWHVAEDGQRQGRYVLRYDAFAGQPYVQLGYTFIITASSNKATANEPVEVRYRNIGLSMPWASREYFFGTELVHPGRFHDADAGNSAYLIQRDDLSGRIYEAGAFANEFGKAEGWMSAGRGGARMSVAVRDFWQQFPKELEVQPQRVLVHAWPAHGEPHTRTGEHLSIRNAYQQWFAHEGEVLDFKIPAEYLEFVRQDSEIYNYPVAPLTNALGLSKTHDMLLYFHADDWETARVPSANALLQANPTVTCDPEWVTASGVFGPIAPRRAGSFEKIEEAIDLSVKSIMRHQEMDRDYGMFNFGNAHHNWDGAARRWSIHRIWYNTHHGWPRWPWLLYARSGDKDLFDWACRNGRYIADIAHCHYSTEAYENLPITRGKALGGLTDYKGFVPWASGNRFHYNSMADALLHHHYFTGHPRAAETALLHGQGLLKSNAVMTSREGSGRATSLQALYMHTWDNDYLDLLERTVQAHFAAQLPNGRLSGWTNFAPFLQRYLDLTQSSEARRILREMTDHEINVNERNPAYNHKIGMFSYAYLHGGDPRHLAVAAHRVNEFVNYQYTGEDPRYHGVFLTSGSNLTRSYFLQEIGYYLAALAQHGGNVQPLVPVHTEITNNWRDPATGQFTFTGQVRNDSGKAQPLLISFRGPTAAKAVLIDPAGNTVAEVQGKSPLKLELRPEQRGPLDVRVTTAERSFQLQLPLAQDPAAVAERYPLPAGGMWIGEGAPFFFALPAGASAVTAQYHGRSWPLRAELFNAQAVRVGEDTWNGANDPAQQPRTLHATRDGAAAWSFSLFGSGGGRLLGITCQAGDEQDAVRWLALRPEHLLQWP